MKLRRSSLRNLVVLALFGGALAGCGDDDGPTGPPALDLDVVQGLYAPTTITFDPQGSAPAADVLSALEEAGRLPELNIARTGTFQMVYRDPVSGEFRDLNGTVQPTTVGIRLRFATQAEANEVLFPREIELAFDEAEATLGTSGTQQVSRARLLELFPDLYADEQLFDPTPGILTVGFVRTSS